MSSVRTEEDAGPSDAIQIWWFLSVVGCILLVGGHLS